MIVAFDTETTGVLWQDDAFCVSVAWDDKEDFFDLRNNVDYAALSWLFDDWSRRGATVVCHNLKFDLQKVKKAGLVNESHIRNIDWQDTMLMAHLLDENRSRRLKDLAKEVLNETTDEAEAIRAAKRKLKLTTEDGYDKLPIEIVKPYALKDARFTFDLYKKFRAEWPAILDDLYANEIALTMALLDVEADGLEIDLDYVHEQKKEYGHKIFHAKRKIAKIVGRVVFDDTMLEPRPLGEPHIYKNGKIRELETKAEARRRCDETTFNPNSVVQLKDAFASRGINLESTDKQTLLNLNDELACAIVELREAMKIRQTYFMGILNERDGKILHGNYRQNVSSGRMSSLKGE